MGPPAARTLAQLRPAICDEDQHPFLVATFV
jgi:hypothetical protein